MNRLIREDFNHLRKPESTRIKPRPLIDLLAGELRYIQSQVIKHVGRMADDGYLQFEVPECNMPAQKDLDIELLRSGRDGYAVKYNGKQIPRSMARYTVTEMLPGVCAVSSALSSTEPEETLKDAAENFRKSESKPELQTEPQLETEQEIITEATNKTKRRKKTTKLTNKRKATSKDLQKFRPITDYFHEQLKRFQVDKTKKSHPLDNSDGLKFFSQMCDLFGKLEKDECIQLHYLIISCAVRVHDEVERMKIDINEFENDLLRETLKDVDGVTLSYLYFAL